MYGICFSHSIWHLFFSTNTHSIYPYPLPSIPYHGANLDQRTAFHTRRSLVTLVTATCTVQEQRCLMK